MVAVVVLAVTGCGTTAATQSDPVAVVNADLQNGAAPDKTCDDMNTAWNYLSNPDTANSPAAKKGVSQNVITQNMAAITMNALEIGCDPTTGQLSGGTDTGNTVPVQTPETEATPAEPWVLTSDLQNIANTGYALQVNNANDAAGKGDIQYLIQDPSTKDVKFFTIDLPQGVAPRVGKFQPEQADGVDPQIENMTGTVIDLDKQKIESGDADAMSPDVSIYILNQAGVTPAQFSSGLTTTPFFDIRKVGPTNVNKFNDEWDNDANGLYMNATGGMNNGLNKDTCELSIQENGNRYYTYGTYADSTNPMPKICFGGQAFYQLANTGNTSEYVTFTYVGSGSWDSAQLPNMNNADVRNLLIANAQAAIAKTVTTTSDGSYTTVG